MFKQSDILKKLEECIHIERNSVGISASNRCHFDRDRSSRYDPHIRRSESTIIGLQVVQSQVITYVCVRHPCNKTHGGGIIDVSCSNCINRQ